MSMSKATRKLSTLKEVRVGKMFLILMLKQC